ncbi:MAG TPA: 50S ribosomal protein L10 [Acidobacteria bacterium]|nr:50S ribosomal protein L10 [Acidobacteriota bacterium]
MVYTRSQKEAQVEQIRGIFESANSIFLVDLTGLDCNEINTLRAGLRDKGARMQVVKNRLAKRAAGEGPVAALEQWFSGPTAMVYHDQEPVTTAKSLVDFAKKHPQLGIKAGLIDRNQTVDGEGVVAVSKLPGLDETRSMLLSLINGPAQKLVRLLNTPSTQLATVLDKHSQQGE